MVVAMDPALQGPAAQVAQRLRAKGRSVDLTLEAKRMKWVFKVRPVLWGQRWVWLALCEGSLQGVGALAGDPCEGSRQQLHRPGGPDQACGVQQAERVNASRLVMIWPDEWAKGLVRVKDLAARTEEDVPQDAL